MKEFTVENMIAACEFLSDTKDRKKLFESFRMMRFHEFISEEVFDAFCEEWKAKYFN